MPRTRERAKLIKRLDDLTVAAVKHGLRLKAWGLSTEQVDDFILCCRELCCLVRSNRYLRPRIYRKRTKQFERYLTTDHDDAMNDEDFKQHFRVTRNSFWKLVGLITDHPVFHRNGSDSRGPAPLRASYQLLILLKYMGSDGNSGSSIAIGQFFGVAKGVVDNCRRDCLTAIISLEDRTYFWPTVSERKAIGNRIKEQYYFPNCVGLIDGTLLPLLSRPSIHGESYMCRKKFYALVMLVVCDDQSRFLYYHIGWPGSVHDNRVWRNCKLNKRPHKYFGKKEYLLGDSAFTASDIMIPPFKAYSGNELAYNSMAFNALLAKPRVKSEHCIGIFKGRFAMFKRIRIKVDSKEALEEIIRYVKAGVILHNYLIEDDIEKDWIEIEEEATDDLEPEATSSTNVPNYSRRNELMFYLSELEETPIN